MRVLLLFFVAITTINASSQVQVDSLVEFSRLEKMLKDPSKTIQIKSRFVGVTSDAQNNIGIVEAKDLFSGETRRAITFARNNNYDTLFTAGNLHIDIEDLKPFLQALQLFKKLITEKNTVSDETYQYTSSNLMVLWMTNREMRKNKWDILLYQRYKNYNMALPGRVLRIKEDEINSMIMLLEKIAAR
jgi:hypothetical protein